MCEFHGSNCNGLGDIWWTDKCSYFSSIDETARLAITAVFCPGLKKGTVLLEEKIFKKGTFVREITYLRALSHAELFSEGTLTLHKLWATQPMFEM